MIGDEWAKAGQELGKAGQEIGKAAGKTVDAAQTAGGFFGKYLAGPLGQASGMLEDRLRFTRWERQMRLAARAQELLAAQGLTGPTRSLPLNVGVPLIEAASLEENNELQDRWAQLLANAADAGSGTDVRRAFIGILADIGPLEAQLLEMIAHVPEQFQDPEGQYVWTASLPNSYTIPSRDEAKASWKPPAYSVEVALWNLSRLGCIEMAWVWGGVSCNGVRATALGKEFIRAVSKPQH